MSNWIAGAIYIGTLIMFFLLAHRQNRSMRMVTPVVFGLAGAASIVIALSSIRESRVSVCVALMLACVVVCAATDLATGLIFDVVTSAAACGILAASVIEESFDASFLGACVCVASLLLLHAISRGRGIGLGDVKLGGIIGASIGGLGSLGAIGSAFVAGAICCAPLLIARRLRRDDRVAFAPYMAAGAIVWVAQRLVIGYG